MKIPGLKIKARELEITDFEVFKDYLKTINNEYSLYFDLLVTYKKNERFKLIYDGGFFLNFSEKNKNNVPLGLLIKNECDIIKLLDLLDEESFKYLYKEIYTYKERGLNDSKRYFDNASQEFLEIYKNALSTLKKSNNFKILEPQLRRRSRLLFKYYNPDDKANRCTLYNYTKFCIEPPMGENTEITMKIIENVENETLSIVEKVIKDEIESTKSENVKKKLMKTIEKIKVEISKSEKEFDI